MAILNDLVVTGQSRLLNKLYVSSGLDVTGNVNLHTGLCIDTYYQTPNSGQLIIKAASNYNAIIRNDGNYTYFLLSSANNSYTFNDLRPLYINNATGKVVMGNGLSIAAGVFSVANTSTFTGKTTHNGGITVNGTTATTSLTASTGLFTNCQVLDTLRTTTWNLDNVASLGGHFYVSPTLFFSSSTTATISAISGTTVTMAIKDSNSIKSNSAGGVTWPSGAKVKLSGRLGNVALGTCTGTLTTAMNATAGTITLTFTFDNASSLSVKAYAASEIHNLAIMMYNNGTYPVGIAMTSYGTNGYSYIDIYGGSTAANNPNVRIGKLDGLPAINSTSPTGWGIYTNNGYFSGVLVSSAGKIGGFTLDSNSIHSGVWGTSGGVIVSTGTGTSKSIGGSSTISGWCFSAGATFGVTNTGAVYCSNINASGGTIGKYTITSTYLITGSGTTCTGMGGDQAFWAGSNTSSSAPFRVSYAGALVATNATITGSITATSGTIGGCSITNGKLTVPAANISGALTVGQLANLQIGGRNLAKKTNYTFGYIDANNGAEVNTNNANQDIYSNEYIAVTAGDVFTITAYDSNASIKGAIYVHLYNTSKTWLSYVRAEQSVYSTTVPISTTFTISQNGYIRYSCRGYHDGLKTKLERGNKATDWTPSPVDIDSAIASNKNILSNWCYNNNTTYINGGNIYAGTITANQLDVASLSAISANLGTITAGSINIGSGKFTVSSAGAMSCTGATINGAVTATSMTANTYYAIYTGSTSTRFIYYDAPEIRIGLPATSTGDLSDLLAGFSFHSSGQTQCWGNLTVSNTLTAPYLKATIDVTAPTVNAATVIGNTWYSSTYGGGWYMSDTTWIRTYGSKNIYQNSGILRTDGTLQVGASGQYFSASSSGTNIGGRLVVSYTGVGGVTIEGSGSTTGVQITRTDTNYGLRVGMSSSNTQGIWACDYNTSSSTAMIYMKPSDATLTTYLPNRIVMAGAYGTSAPPTSGTLVKGMVYFQIIS